MASSTTLCGPCSERHITKPSEYWCAECEEAICDDCREHHKVFKATRSHELMSIDKYKSLPSFITNIHQSCTYHNEKYQQYCIEDASPICFKCIKEHQKCNVIPLDEVTNNAKTSGHLQDLETRLIDLLHNIDGIQKDRKANLVSIEKRKEGHLTEIKQIRNQINKHLNKLEKEIKQDLEEKEGQCKKSIQSILSSVEEKKKNITEYQTNLQNIKQNASGLQTFLLLRNIEMKVFKNEQYLQSLVETNQFERVELFFKVEPGVLSVLDSLKNLGSIEIKKTSSSIRLIKQKDKEAQLQLTPTKTINDVKIILQKKITTNGESIRGCCMSVNSEYFFTDYFFRKTLSIMSADGRFRYPIWLHPSNGFDLTLIDEKTIAITSGAANYHNGIDIINIESRKKIMFISLPGQSWGITRDHDSMYVCVEGRGIYRVNTLDYTTSHLISCNLSGATYISVFAEKIYYTDWSNHTVDCCDRNGSSVWRFKEESVLRNPRGITVDNDGHVFVVGELSSNVVIISNDGKHHRHILTKEQGLSEPSAIFFDKQTGKLLVANTRKNAFLYSVT